MVIITVLADFFVPIEPVAQERPRFNPMSSCCRRPRDPQKSKQAKFDLGMYAKKATMGSPLITGPVDVLLITYRKIPKGTSKIKEEKMLAGEIVPETKPDTSNYLKLVEDALNNVVWEDDSRIIDIVTGKRYGQTPGYRIIVKEHSKKDLLNLL